MEITEEKLKEMWEKFSILSCKLGGVAVGLEDKILSLRRAQQEINELCGEIALLIKKAQGGPS